MKPADNVAITFATQVLTRGCRNGIVNVNMGAFEFNPGEGKVEADLVCTLRLRTDIQGAIALRDALSQLLETIQPDTPAVPSGEQPIGDEETAKH